LEIYWKLCFPDQPFQRKDKRWTEVGFQGPDPGTDFRGAGVFGLRHLIFFAQTHPDEFQRFQKSGYPLSIAGLNITMLIYSCLGWGFKKLEIDNSKKRALYEYLFGENDRGVKVEKLYSRIFLMLDAEWKAQNATYMMFPQVLQSVQTQFVARMAQICMEEKEEKDLISF
jgi:engulfment and cell motility protein 2